MSLLNPMKRSPLRLLHALAFTLAFNALACGGAFRDAMDAGDAFAQQGHWEAATASYEKAVRLDPDSEEAHTKWTEAKRRLSAIRTQESKAMLARGEVVQAAKASHQAMVLDPQNTEAKALWQEARTRSLAQTEALIQQGKLEEALQIAQILRSLEPRDRQFIDLEARCFDLIANRAYDKAMAYLSNKKLGNALLSFNEVERVRPGYRDVKIRLVDIRNQLEDEIRLVLQVVRTPAGESNGPTAQLEEALLRWEPDSRFRLSMATDQPPKAGSQFVRIFSKLGTVTKTHDVANVGRSCTYVCGVDRVANPEHEAARRRVNDAERQMKTAEANEKQAKQKQSAAAQAYSSVRSALSVAAAKEKTAKSQLETCLSKAKPGQTCPTEETQANTATSERMAAEAREHDASEALDRAEAEASQAETEAKSAREHWNRMVNELAKTPTTVQVDRICEHNYAVEVHTFGASATLQLRVHVTGDAEPSGLPPKLLQFAQKDETFAATPGRCEEVAAGDLLKTPTDAELDAAVVKLGAEEIRNRVALWYGLYVESYKSEESNARTNGQMEDANEAYIRHRLLGPGLAY